MIRSATTSDQEAIQQLVFSILRSYGLEPSPQSTDADLFDLDHFYFSDGGDFSVLLNESYEIIGTVALFKVNADTCEFRKMYLSPDCRGKGYGKQLLEYAITKARSLGFHCITLETASVLKEAIRLYEKYGFKPYTADHLSPRCDQAYRLYLKEDT